MSMIKLLRSTALLAILGLMAVGAAGPLQLKAQGGAQCPTCGECTCCNCTNCDKSWFGRCSCSGCAVT